MWNGWVIRFWCNGAKQNKSWYCDPKVNRQIVNSLVQKIRINRTQWFFPVTSHGNSLEKLKLSKERRNILIHIKIQCYVDENKNCIQKFLICLNLTNSRYMNFRHWIMMFKILRNRNPANYWPRKVNLWWYQAHFFTTSASAGHF